jgi:hypothetical protein
MASKREREAAEKERQARERGRAIPHYTRKVAKELSTPGKEGKLSPPKRAP